MKKRFLAWLLVFVLAFSLFPTAALADGNTAPALAEGVPAAAAAVVDPNTAYALDLTAVFADADGDALTYSVSVNGAEAVSADAAYRYTPTVRGNTALVFTASDGTAVSPAYTVTLTADTAPALASGASAAAAATVTAGTAYALDLTGIFTDADGDALSYAVSPAVGTFDGASFRYTPAGAGETALVFTADDGARKSSDTYTVTLTAAAAKELTVYVTVSDQGVLPASGGAVMANVPVTVTGDYTGKATVDAVLTAFHAAYCPGGYATSTGAYGLGVTKLWGNTSGNYLFFVNGEGLASGVGTDTMVNGDRLLASVNKDSVYYADWYAAFDRTAVTVTAGDDLTLTLRGHLGMAWTAADKENVPLAGVTVGTAADGAFTALSGKVTGADGQVTLSFARPGTYYVSASGTVSDEVTDYATSQTVTADCPIMAPVCVVTVKPAVELTVYVTVSDQGVLPASGGAVMANVPVTVTGDYTGKATVDAVLTAFHAAYCPGGYATSTGAYGLGVTKLWGNTSGNYLFFVNGEGLASGVGTDTMVNGDRLLASVNKDSVYYADWYAAFDRTAVTVTAGDDLTLTLRGHLGMAWTAADKENVPLAGVTVGTAADGVFTALSGKVTGADGRVTLSFARPGTYYVSASGTVSDEVTDYATSQTVTADCPIMAPVCTVTVLPAVTVYVTVSDQGVLPASGGAVMANVPVTVTGDSAGKATVDAVLTAFHAAYCPGGYAASAGAYGTSVTRLWGETGGNYLFFVNGEGLASGVGTDTVVDGDRLLASVNKDSVYYADWYAAFDRTAVNVALDEEFTLTLRGHLGMAWTAADKENVPLAGVTVGTAADGVFTALSGKVTGADGRVTLSFARPGTYYVSASGTVSDEVTDYATSQTVTADCPIMAPVCVVTVENRRNITVNVTVNDRGSLAVAADGTVMAGVPVTLRADANGVATVDEALRALHEAYCPGGYTASAGSYGTSVTKLWGETGGNFLFFVNGEGLASGVGTDTVKDGDDLTASVNADNAYYADWYSFFTPSAVTVGLDEEFTLTLRGHLGMAWTAADKENVPLAGAAVGTVSGAGFRELNGATTDADGRVTLSFPRPGTYYISASGTVSDEVTDYATYQTVTADCPIIAPACVVTVEARRSITAYVTVNNQGVLPADAGGQVMADVPVTVAADADGKATVDAVLTAFHAARCPGGYAASAGTYGLGVTRLWGNTDGNYLFFINGAGLASDVGTDTLRNGDHLLASVNADNTYYADWYAAFGSAAETVTVGEELTLTLKGHPGMAWTAADKKNVPLSGLAVGTAASGVFTPLAGKVTDANGQVTLSFSRPGTYYVSASGTVSDEVTDYATSQTVTADCPIMAPVCVVTVELDPTAVILPAARNITLDAPGAGAGESAVLTAAWSDGRDTAAYPITWEIVSGQEAVSLSGSTVTALAPGDAVLKASGSGRYALVYLTVLPASDAGIEAVYLGAASATINLAQTDHTAVFDLFFAMSDGSTRESVASRYISSVSFGSRTGSARLSLSTDGDRLTFAVPDALARTGAYRGTLTFTIDTGEGARTYQTASVTVKVVNSRPGVKASVDTLNTFFSDASALLRLTPRGGEIALVTLTDDLGLFDYDPVTGLITAKEGAAVARKTYKLAFRVAFTGFAEPVDLNVWMKCAPTMPSVRLKSGSVTLLSASDVSAALQLASGTSRTAYDALRVSGVSLPTSGINTRTYPCQSSFAVTQPDANGAFTLTMSQPIAGRYTKVLLRVSFENGSGTRDLTVGVGIRTPSASLSRTSLTLNGAAGPGADAVSTLIRVSPQSESAEVTGITLLAGKTESELTALRWSLTDGALTFRTKAATAAGTYRLRIYVADVAKPLALTVRVSAAEPKLRLSVRGSLDILSSESTVAVTPTLSGLSAPLSSLISADNVRITDADGNDHAELAVKSVENGVISVGWRNWSALGNSLNALRYNLVLRIDGTDYRLAGTATLRPVQGSSRATVSGAVQLYSRAPYTTGSFRLSVSRGSIGSVAIANAAGDYVLYDHGNGIYSLGFRNNTAPARYRSAASVKLIVTLEGGAKTISATLPVNIAR